MKQKQLYIIGAGFAGRTIAQDLIKHQSTTIIAFLDDDPAKIGSVIWGTPVIGPISEVIPFLKTNFPILLAIPSLSNNNLYQLYQQISQSGFKDIKLLPALSQLICPEGSMALVRNIDASDFLGREPLVLNMHETLGYIRDKRVLITGAGGSIGSELARQLLIGGASRLYIFGHGENTIYKIEKELHLLQAQGIGSDATIIPIIGEMQDEHYIYFLLGRLKAQIIFHCAAHKHVPLMEKNSVEAIKNNVFGVLNLVKAAKKIGVERFALISTDKAVDPYNIYGCSKALGEKIIIAAHAEGFPFFIVRFGNVLGSNGSIIPLFQEQIGRGGPITITDPEVRRFFMTIPEAVSLVLLAGSDDSKAALYLLDMGESIKIIDLAAQVASVYGLNIKDGDIEIKIIGLRDGEKLNEKLYGNNEDCCPTKHSKLFEIKQKQLVDFNLDILLESLKAVCYYQEPHSLNFRNKNVLYTILERVFPSLEKKNHLDAY